MLRKNELKFLEIIGIKHFQKAILFIEKVKHRKDAGRNENYHVRSGSLCDLRSFTGYLIYNALCHVISLLFVAIYFTLIMATGMQATGFSIAMVFVAILDIYCILLQRYTYLRLSSLAFQLQKKRDGFIRTSSAAIATQLMGQPIGETESDFLLICRIRECSVSGKDCLLTEKDLPALQRMALSARARKIHCGNPTDTVFSATAEPILPQMKVRVQSALQRRVSFLQNLLRTPKARNVCYSFSIMTESPQVERAYQKVFPAYSRDSMETTIAVLHTAYNSAISMLKGSKHDGNQPR